MYELNCLIVTSAIRKVISNCLPRKSQNRIITADNPIALAKKFSGYFTSVGSMTAQKARDLAAKYNFDTYPSMTAVESTPDQTPELFQFQTVSAPPSNKAPGYDKISIRVIKDSLPMILPSVASIMNTSFHLRWLLF